MAVFFGILAALLGAFVGLIRLGAPRTPAERFCAVLPVGVYTGWATVATFANVATALKAPGFGGFGLSVTIVWALVRIAIANLTRGPSPPVAVVAGGAAVLIALAALRARTAAPTPAPR